MNKDKATPRPWKYQNEKSNLRQWSMFTIYGNKPPIVDEYYGTFEGSKIFIANIEKQPNNKASQANAELIIKAVNNFDSMFNLLKTLQNDCEMALSGEWDRSNEGFQAMLDNIEGLIEKIESEE